MQDLFELHKEVLASVDNGTITVEEAEVLYDEMFEEQVNSLILDVYEAYDEGVITVGECNEYLTTIAEAAKGDKLDKKEEKKIDKELDNVPENERKAIEDSIKKASKEAKVKKAAAIAGGAAATALALKAIDNGIKAKKRKVRSEKDVKESAEDIMAIEAMLEELSDDLVLEGANTDLADNMKALNREVAEKNKEYRALLKDKKYKEALKVVDDIDKIIDKYADIIDNIDSDIAETVIGIICHAYISTIKSLVVGLAASLVGFGNEGASLTFAYQNIKALYGLAKSVISKGDISVSDLNMYKQNFKASIEVMRSISDMKRKAVKAKMEKEKETKESVDDILDLDAELALFEKADIDVEDIKDIAVIGTIVTLITAPFVYTIGKTIKFNKNFNKANKYSKECTKIAREIEDLRDEANKKVDELNKKYKALYKKAPIINKYYIPKNKKDEIDSLKNQFAELKAKYDSNVADLEEKYKKAYRAYQDSLQNTIG